MRIYGAKYNSPNSGPSPNDDLRTEIFLAGCLKASLGFPCKGCFNAALWETEPTNCPEQSVKEVFDEIMKTSSNNRYITFVGGEPLDQLHELSELCNLLHKENFHILIITHYKFNTIRTNYKDMADIWIDGEYKEEYRIYDESKKNNVCNVIGSSNQSIYCRDTNKNWFGISSNNINSLKLDDEYVYFYFKEEFAQRFGRKDNVIRYDKSNFGRL